MQIIFKKTTPLISDGNSIIWKEGGLAYEMQNHPFDITYIYFLQY